MAQFTMDIQGKSQKFYVPSLGEYTIRQGQTFQEDGSLGKELIKYHGEHVILGGPSALELLGNNKNTLDKLEGLVASASEIDEIVTNINASTKSQLINRLVSGSNSTASTDVLWRNGDIVAQDSYLDSVSFYATRPTNAAVCTIKIIVLNSSHKILAMYSKDITIGTTLSLYTIDNISLYAPVGSYIGIHTNNLSTLNYNTSGGSGELNRYALTGTETIGTTLTLVQSIPSYYIRTNVTLKYTTVTTVINNGNSNYLQGKHIIAIGDSMVKGHSLFDSQTWLYKLATRAGMTYTNYGINGAYLTYNGTVTNSVYDRVTNSASASYINPSTADIILIFIGTNDASNSITIGTESSTSSTEIYGALKAVITNLQSRYPAAKIGFITPYRRNANFPVYVTALENCCALYGIPVFNNLKNGNIDWSNTAQVSALTLGDSYHLNDAGMTFASYKYEQFARQI